MGTPHYSPARLALRRRQTQIGMALRERLPENPAPGQAAILWVHGLGESAYCFEDLMAAPELEGWHQLAPDLPGYGKSLWPTDPYVLEGHARTLGRLLDEIDVGRVVVAGHSMGGVIATHFARLLKRRTAGVLNIEGNISLADCTFSGRIAGQPLEPWLETGYAQFLAGIHESATAPGPDGAPASRESAAILRGYAASVTLCDPRQLRQNAIDLVEISRRESLAADLAALEIPVLYAYGAPRGTGEHSRSLLRAAGIPLLEIAPAGHWCYLDQPAQFLSGMLDFLDRIAPPPVLHPVFPQRQ